MVTVVPYPLNYGQIALRSYQHRLVQDQELRSQGATWANIGIDDVYVHDLRDGIAGRLPNLKLSELVGHRIDWFKKLGNTNVEFDTPAWRSLAQALVSRNMKHLRGYMNAMKETSRAR
jgi:hypothetical protein